MTPVDLKIHENQDQSEIPFSCTQCASTLANPADMKINENQNQNEKPFSCSLCNSKSVNMMIWRCIISRTKIKTHSAALNGTLNLQIWGSEVTWKSGPNWKTFQLLQLHQKENPFSCTQCASKFMHPVDLKIHENQDQSEKPFSCTECASTLCKSCWSEDKWTSDPKWKTIQRLLIQL